MNVLVVGGTGFFGIPMVEKLITDGHDVTISKGMISTHDIIKYIEERTGKKALLDNKSDFAPYNGYFEKVSYDTTKAESTGFQFSNIDTWIYDLIDSYL